MWSLWVSLGEDSMVTAFGIVGYRIKGSGLV